MVSRLNLSLPPHLTQASSPVPAEVYLQDLNEKQFLASLGALILRQEAWSCFSLPETSRLLRPLQICPALTGTSVLAQNATAEITYKFLMADGRVGTMTGLISLEDFRGDKLKRVYDRLHIPKLIDKFMESVVTQVIDHLKPVFAREEDESLWQETIIFLPRDLHHESFRIRGLRQEAIPRGFLPHLQRIYEVITTESQDFPNLSFQLCLRAYLDHNEIKNRELLSLLLSKYFYTLFRQGGASENLTALPSVLSSGSGKLRRRALANLLTLDNDSSLSLEAAGFGQELLDRYLKEEETHTQNELEDLRKNVKEAQAEIIQAKRIIAQFREEEKQELIRRISDPDKFLILAINQLFEDIFNSLPGGVHSEYGVVWIPKTSYLDESKRDSLLEHLDKVTQDAYLLKISYTESTVISYWKVLAESFYHQWILNQYRRLQDYNLTPEELDISILPEERFVSEVQLRFAARHLEIVQQNTLEIIHIVVDRLAQRVSINTSQQTLQAMQNKLALMLGMHISQNDIQEIKHLAEHFTDTFVGRKEKVKSPYPAGTLLEAYAEISNRPKTGRTMIGMEILNLLYQEYGPDF
jgi:hypothetical protein